MKAIDFVVRDQAGGMQRGTVLGNAQTDVIPAEEGQEISLNLRQHDLHSRIRSGNALVITLNDGRVITVDGYFDGAGNRARLFTSIEGYLEEVTLDADAARTDGTTVASDRQDGVTLTGTARAGTTVAVHFGTGCHAAAMEADGSWTVDFPLSEVPLDASSAPITAVATDSLGARSIVTGEVDIGTLLRDFRFSRMQSGINNAPTARGIDLAGQVEAGARVVVAFNDTSHEAVVDAQGQWRVTISPASIPSGRYEAAISVTAVDPAGNSETLTDVLTIDTDAPDGPVVKMATKGDAGAPRGSADTTETGTAASA